MTEIRISLSENLNEEVNKRASELNLTRPEYLRELAKLDISFIKYQKMINCLNILHNKINECHKVLGYK